VGDVGDGGEEHPAGLNCIPFLLSFLFLVRGDSYVPRDLRTAHRWIHFVVPCTSPAEGRELVPFVSACFFVLSLRYISLRDERCLSRFITITNYSASTSTST
jgi:hypothetical protein